MKKVLVTFVLALTTAAMAQGNSQQQSGVTAKGAKVQVTSEPNQPPQQQGQQPGQSGQTQSSGASSQGNTPASQKTIKDPAEYNAYITALNTQDPAQKAAAMEAFVTQYPQSIVKIDALEQAMAAYQQGGNQAKVEDTANRLLQLDPNNIRALAIITFLKRSQATGAQDPQKVQSLASEARQLGEKGLGALPSWTKPEGLSEADFEKLRNQMTEIFAGAAGFGALQNKDYANARNFYAKSVQVDPNNMQDIYQFAIADLESNPMDLNGFWYCGKAINLAQGQNNAQAAQGIGQYCKAKYHKYSGKDEGWDQLVAATASQTAPAANFTTTIPKAPTPCELAVQAVQQNDPKQLSFSDWEFILQQRDCSPANKEAADKVWAAIQSMQTTPQGVPAKLKIPVKVIAATKDSIQAAITDENQTANKADLTVTMDKPMLRPPAQGATVEIVGNITNYQPSPFMFTMEKGEVPGAKAPVRGTKGSTKGSAKGRKKK